MGMNKIDDRLIDNDQPGHDDQCAFDCGAEEFGLAMTIGVIFIPGLGGDMEAIQADETGDDIDCAFERVG
jgi:hypothetical protein